MKKKTLLLVCALAIAPCAVGCGGTQGGTGDSGSGDSSAAFDIVDSVLTMDCFENHALEVENTGGGKVEWSSSNPSVVTVDEQGNLTSKLQTGTATITAKSGKYSDSCEVTVLQKSGMPSFSVENAVYLSAGGNYAVTAKMLYNGVDIAEYLSFSVNEAQNNAAAVATATVQGNAVTFGGVETGDTAYTLYTTVFDRLYAETIDVSVRNTDLVYVVKDAVNNQLQVKEGSQPSTSNVQIYYKNERVPDESLTWQVADETVVTIGEGGKLVMGMEGTTSISTTCHGKKISVEVRVMKKHESVTVAQDSAANVNLDVQIVVDKSAKTRTYLPNEAQTCQLQIADENAVGTVVGATLDGQPLDVQYFTFANGVVSVAAKAFGTDVYGEKTLTVDVENATTVRTYTLKTLVITKITRTLTDFQAAVTIRWQGDKIVGYFAMDRDLDFAKTEISEWATDWNWDHGFRGTLDGMGHSLTNYRSLMYGITAQMGKGAVIKNLKFVDARYDGGETTFFARGACGVTFENIEITLSADSSCSFSSNENSCGVLVSHDMRQCVYKNITIHAEGKELQRIFGGTNQERNSSTYDNIKIYAVSVERYENDTSRRPKGVSLIKG